MYDAKWVLRRLCWCSERYRYDICLLTFIYLFIYYEWSYNTYIVQDESANKVIKKEKKITTTQNAKSSHTSRRMQTCYHQKNQYLTVRRVQRPVQPVKWHYAYHCHQHDADNYYTELYYGYQRSTGEKIRKVPVELWTAKSSIAPSYRLMPLRLFDKIEEFGHSDANTEWSSDEDSESRSLTFELLRKGIISWTLLNFLELYNKQSRTT